MPIQLRSKKSNRKVKACCGGSNGACISLYILPHGTAGNARKRFQKRSVNKQIA